MFHHGKIRLQSLNACSVNSIVLYYILHCQLCCRHSSIILEQHWYQFIQQNHKATAFLIKAAVNIHLYPALQHRHEPWQTEGYMRQWNERMDKGFNISLKIASIWSKVHIPKYLVPQTSTVVTMWSLGCWWSIIKSWIIMKRKEYEAETQQKMKNVRVMDGQTSGTCSSVRTCLKGPSVAHQNSTAILTHETDRSV